MPQHTKTIFKSVPGAFRMSQWVKALADTGWSELIPRTPIAEEDQLLESSDFTI